MRRAARIFVGSLTVASVLGCVGLGVLAFVPGEFSVAVAGGGRTDVSVWGDTLCVMRVEEWPGPGGWGYLGPDDVRRVVAVVAGREPGSPGAAIGLRTWRGPGVSYDRYAFDVHYGYREVRVPSARRPGWQMSERAVLPDAWHRVLPVGIVRVNLWLAWAVLLATPVCRVAAAGVRWVGRRGAARRGRCAGCGYDLRATPGRCPECGRRAGLGGGA